MKNICFAIIFTFLLMSPVCRTFAQSSTATPSQPFDTTGFPQWAKDMRRWDIIAFGVFPFAVFFTTFAYDMYLWNDANGMDMSEEGRRYAPWPLKSAGAVEKNKEDFERTLLIAAGLSVTLAFTDLIIVIIKRNIERKRIESIPTGSIEIRRSKYDDEELDKAGGKADLVDIFELINAVNINFAASSFSVEEDDTPDSADSAETD